MGLSTELLSEFAKITNDSNNQNKTETIAYGKTVVYNGQTYVQLDGSELLTPVTTTVTTKDDDRVQVMIKDHTATIMGNITNPSAGSDEVSELGRQVGEFKTVIADKVDAEQLEAEIAKINELKADAARVEELEADMANIDTIVAEKVDAQLVDVDNLIADKVEAKVGDMDILTADDLTSINADIYNLQSTYADFEVATTKNFEAINAEISDLDAKYATVEQLEATNANVSSLESDIADISTLMFGSASGTSIHTEFANAVIAQLGDAQIKSAMIESVSASKLTAGTIYTDDVTITSQNGNMVLADNTIQISDGTRTRVQIGKDASDDYSINIWDADGNLMFSKGGITDSAIKDAIIRNDMVSENANISASKLDIDSLFTEINGSSNTIKSTKIYLDDEAQTLDIAFKSMTNTVDDLSSTQTSQGTAISAIQGQITSKIWQQDITTAVNNVELGNRNLIPSSRLIKDGVGPWTVTFTTVTNGQSDPFGNTNATAVKTTLANTYALITKNKVIKQLGKYSLSIWMKADKATTVNIVLSADTNTDNKTVCAVTTEWKRFTMTVDVTTLNRTYDLVIGGWSSFDTTATVHIAYPMLVYGSKPMDWSPAPEDTDASISTLSTNYSTLNQTVSGIQTTVGSHTTSINSLGTRVSSTESSITQHANLISTKVSENGVISAINQTAETIKIEASKINLVGAVTADCITSNAITSAKIATDALKSRNYVAGSTGSFLNLADGSFDSKNLQWTADGTLNTTNANIYGDIHCKGALYMYSTAYNLNFPLINMSFETENNQINFNDIYGYPFMSWTEQEGLIVPDTLAIGGDLQAGSILASSVKTYAGADLDEVKDGILWKLGATATGFESVNATSFFDKAREFKIIVVFAGASSGTPLSVALDTVDKNTRYLIGGYYYSSTYYASICAVITSTNKTIRLDSGWSRVIDNGAALSLSNATVYMYYR